MILKITTLNHEGVYPDIVDVLEKNCLFQDIEISKKDYKCPILGEEGYDVCKLISEFRNEDVNLVITLQHVVLDRSYSSFFYKPTGPISSKYPKIAIIPLIGEFNTYRAHISLHQIGHALKLEHHQNPKNNCVMNKREDTNFDQYDPKNIILCGYCKSKLN